MSENITPRRNPPTRAVKARRRKMSQPPKRSVPAPLPTDAVRIEVTQEGIEITASFRLRRKKVLAAIGVLAALAAGAWKAVSG